VAIVAESRLTPTISRSANLIIFTSGVQQANSEIGIGNLSSISAGKISTYYKAGAIGSGFNGNTIATYTTVGNLSSAITQITIGNGPGNEMLNGTISKLQIWSGVVTSSELSALTIQ
jgi:hypothetical protein